MNLVYIWEIFFTFRPAPKVHVQKLLLLPCVIGQYFEAHCLQTQVNQSGNTVFWSIFSKKKIFFLLPIKAWKLCVLRIVMWWFWGEMEVKEGEENLYIHCLFPISFHEPLSLPHFSSQGDHYPPSALLFLLIIFSFPYFSLSVFLPLYFRLSSTFCKHNLMLFPFYI